jgi:hypothetical protein
VYDPSVKALNQQQSAPDWASKSRSTHRFSAGLTCSREGALSPQSNTGIPVSPSHSARFKEVSVPVASPGVQQCAVRPQRLSPGPGARSLQGVIRQRSAASPPRRCGPQMGQGLHKTVTGAIPSGYSSGCFKWPPQVSSAAAVRSAQKVLPGYPVGVPHQYLTQCPTPLRSPSPAHSFVPDALINGGVIMPETPTLDDRNAMDSVYVPHSQMMQQERAPATVPLPSGSLSNTQSIEYAAISQPITSPQVSSDAVYLSVASLRTRIPPEEEVAEQRPPYHGRFIDVAGDQ